MKKFIVIIFLSLATIALAGIDHISDELNVYVKDSYGNMMNCGRVQDYLKILPVETQLKLDEKLAAKADKEPLEARRILNAAKDQGAAIQKATEDKIVAAEAEKAAADAEALQKK